MPKKFLFLLGSIVMLGAGCSNPFAVSEMFATDIHAQAGATMLLQDTTFGFDNPLTKEPVTTVRVEAWDGTTATLAWEQQEQRETQASQEAREQAFSAPVGSGVVVPDVVYETVTRTGTLTADALDGGTKFALPSLWNEGAQDLTGEGGSLLWLSRNEYETLVTTRHATVTLGEVDAFLDTLLSSYDQAAATLNALQGNETATPTAEGLHAFTTLTAEPDWGSYTLQYGDKKVRVPIVVAENAFAKFEILANPHEPLVLSVTQKSTSWLLLALQTLHPNIALRGYRITQISPASAHQPQPATQ